MPSSKSKKVSNKKSDKRTPSKKVVVADSIIIFKNVNAIQTILDANTYNFRGKFREFEEDSQNCGGIPTTIITTMDECDSPQSLENISDKRSRNIDNRTTFFIDEHKTLVQYWPTMIDICKTEVCKKGEFLTKDSVVALGPSSKFRCWWDHHTFSGNPWGCPLRYYNSLHSRSKFISRMLKINNITYDSLDFYEVEGIFCSPECVKAYILNDHTVKRKDSLSLLSSLVLKLTSSESNRGEDPISDNTFEKVVELTDISNAIDITPAPSWKLLKVYGGHLTIEEFRSKSYKVVYKETVNVKRPYMYYVCDYFTTAT